MEDDDYSTFLVARFDPSEHDACFTLSVANGPDAGKSWQLDANLPPRVLIGLGPACDVRLTDPTVSRRHAALELEGDRLRVTDLGSKNGTSIDGTRVISGYAKGGETLDLGATRFAVSRAKAAGVQIPERASFGRMLGASTEMRRIYALCERLARVDIPVILEGETGTGKELLAECLHEEGPRAGRPFVVFDCTAVPATLVETELFGHERGAFTGATSTRKGLFEQAEGGTLLLDEIGDLDIALQAKLLRAIERREIRPVGSNVTRRVDVRILAATRRDLDREVQERRFRDDLYHRLAVARLELPPLRKRHGDVWVLARRFAEEMGFDAGAIPAQVLARWNRDDWPGNVRELRNAVARQLVLGDLAMADLGDDARGAEQPDEEPSPFEGPGAPRPPVEPVASVDPFEEVLALGLPLQQARERVLSAFSRRYLERVLTESGGNVTRAARTSGVTRRYLQMLRAKLGG